MKEGVHKGGILDSRIEIGALLGIKEKHKARGGEFLKGDPDNMPRLAIEIWQE